MNIPGKLASKISYINWSVISEYKFPVLNRAIDKHTYWGRTYLGRTNYDFAMFGSQLNNHTPWPGENEMKDHFIKLCDKPKSDLSQPRDYQRDIISNAVPYFRKNDTGWLIMACGTGKTKTAYWIHEKIAPMFSIVVLPYLEILKQFLEVWSQMSNARKLKYHYGIIASTRKDFMMSNFMTYSYIRNKSQYDIFQNLSTRKVLFVTYASMKKLKLWKPEPEFMIYDEAHHYKEIHSLKSKSLYLTATPKYIVPEDNTIGFYHLNKAIKAGHLTDYNINIFPYNNDYTDNLSILFRTGNKVIIYTSTVSTAKELYTYTSDSLFNVYYIEANTPQVKRDEIFKEFKKQGTKCAIFNCATLGEGVDLPCCDSIYIHSGYNSQQRVVQSFGRPLRLYPGKTKAHIYICYEHHKKKLKAISFYDTDAMSKVNYI